MSFVFPYQYEPNDGYNIPYPIVPIFLNTITGKKLYSFILDSGADFTTMPLSMIGRLCLKQNQLKTKHFWGISAKPVNSYLSEVELNINGFILTTICVFTDNNQTPMLLGKYGLFENFTILFNNTKKQLEFEKISI